MKEAKIKRQLLKEIESLKDKKGFIEAGLPRFGRLFSRDSLIVSWQLLNTNPKIAQKTLEILIKFQGKKINKLREEEPGKIIHETDLKRKKHPEGYFPFPYYGSVDSTPLFLIIFSFCIKKTKNKEFLRKYWQNILAALNWMEKYGDSDKDGFLEYKRKNPMGLFHQGWKDSFKNHLGIKPPVAIVEVQGYQYLALREISKLAIVMRDNDLARKLSDRAKKLKKNFNKKFWMKKKKYFALALNGKKRQRKAITSNPGHLLFTGIIEKDKIKPTVKRLFQKDLWTPFGIRTHSTKESDFNHLSYHLGSVWPHDNWVIAQGLKKYGFKKEYLKIKKALLRTFKELECLPEFYGVSLKNRLIFEELQQKPCYPQAWASGALLDFLKEK